MDARAYFEGKRITVMGLGLLGRGVGDIRFLYDMGSLLTVTDLKTEDQLAPSLETLGECPGIIFRLGGHSLEDFRDKDLILKAPKTPLDSIYIAEAQKNGIPVTMSTAFFAKLAQGQGATIVGVTGTRGKTTTTEMIAHVLGAAGKDVLLGGNIRGVSTLALLPSVTKDTIAVLELDSWQLQGFRAEKISPDIAVFTTFYPDHMDYYGGDMEKYLMDKAGIFLHQQPLHTLVLGAQCADIVEQTYRERIASHIVRVSGQDFPPDWKLQVLGEHNRYNAALAVAAARALMIDDEHIQTALQNFPGVAGRLEFVAEKNGVKFYNDTTATTPEATLAALRAFGNNKNIILLVGGSDKGLDMNELLLEIPKFTKRVIMLAGSGTNLVLPFIPDASVFDSLQSAFEEAVRSAVSGDIILFSPALASFGMFKNEYDRGDQFMNLVRAL